MKDGRAELKEEGCTGRDLCEQCCGQICLLVEKPQERFYEPPEHLFRDQPADEQ
ncbi:MAG TPA: hypothetical protein PKW43_07820 [Deltaproteobacteria bacterium]|nr:hypothetical protein [Deltaproteobacteria bacterium]